VIYEFQTMICELYGMPCANASLYDGGSALAEAVMLSRGHTKKRRIVWSDAVNPNYRRVTETITSALGVSFVTGRTSGGKQTANDLAMLIDEQTAAIVLQYPNFYGVVDDLRPIIAKAHANGALVIVVADPIAMGLLTPPGEMGADVVVGEGQSLGNYMSFGGPYLGLFATTDELVRLMPGRVVGMTKDVDGRRGYVLTLQTREQHIRRDKATSNICTNQGLIATRATLYLSMLGPTGLRELGLSCSRRCHYLMDELAKIPGYQQPHKGPHFREFLLTVPISAEKFCEFMTANGVLAGVPLSRLGLSDDRSVLVALTENRTVEEMDNFVTLARRFAKEVAV
ncbi:aminomethyl-transferring glycine dehydrogenase subunit GcvPA, partial [bacterium]|nr:aminomethyl-transferring glycine dehydrogenase subunit GcvPA [bacterium]